ncbi:MAG: aromatic ring-hydroxylating dioxygenase subunit alpha, partial [Acidimicrobiia bacterium]|nr:aromatic ring-hydroxylating dioxygenase subunit alpha [Acidimicrobiia bacterium]
LTELRCGYHRWAWDLTGRLREVPSRKGFGVISSDDYSLIDVAVDTWGPLVWINLDTNAMPLVDYLDDMPADTAWAELDEFRCSALLSTALACNWKTLIDGFSETYHVQGIHPEMLPMVDDVNSPQQVWNHVGKLSQPYGIASPRLRDVSHQQVWDGFVEVMGGRIGIHDPDEAGPAPDVEPGEPFRDHLAERIRAEYQRRHGVDLDRFATEHLLDLSQYNVFPNVTILVFGDMLQIVKSRPGPDPDHCVMDVMAFDRARSGADRSSPVTVTMAKDDVDLGLVLNQDLGNIERAQRGLHQPGFDQLSLSGEECRIINLHRNLERYIPDAARSGASP